MVTLRGAESAAFTQVMEVTQTRAERGRTGRTREVMPQERGKETGARRRRKGGRVGGTLDFSPRRHADLNGGLAPNGFASCAR